MGPESWRRNVIALTVYALFRGFAVGGYQALYSAYMKTLGYSMAGIGAAVTASSLAAALIAPGFGAVIEVLGAKTTTTLTGLLSLAATLLPSAPKPSYLHFTLSYISYMLAFALGQPARSTLLAKSVSPELHGYYFAVTTVAFSAARIVGPLAAGWIASRNYPQAFQVMTLSVAIGLTAFHALAVEPETVKRRVSLRVAVREAYRRALKPNPHLARLYTFLILDRSGWSLWFPLLSAHLKAAGYNEEQIGLLYTIASLVQTSASIPMGKLADKLGPTPVIASSEALGAVAAVLLANPKPLPVPATALSLAGLSIAAWVPAYNKLIPQIAGERLGEAYASANAVRSLAGTPTPIIGGALYQTISPKTPFAISAAILAAATLYTRKLAAPNTAKHKIKPSKQE
jgi:MFS family permease